MEVGTDIENVARFKKLDTGDSFLTNNYTDNEIKYCFSHSKPAIHLAGFFAAKEAARKTFDESCSLKELEIVHNKEGKPQFLSNDKLKLSISHTDELAIAVVVREI